MFGPQLIREALSCLHPEAPDKRIAQKYNSGPHVPDWFNITESITIV